jgi:hypothetical protein
MGEGVLDMSSMKLNISQDQILEPPSFEIGSKGMFIWGGNCLVSYKNETNKIRIKESHPMFCKCEEKTKSYIILQVMKYEPPINRKPKKTNQMKVRL